MSPHRGEHTVRLPYTWGMQRFAILALLALPLASLAVAQNGDRKGETQGDLPVDLEIPPAPALGPEAEHATFEIQDGFEVQLVAAEPLVVDPVQLTFDEQGRLWVVEMRGYMQDAEGSGELDPVGVIAVLTDTDGDGTMDERTEFASDLVLPRGVAPMHGGALCVLPPELVFLRDDDGDGAFDVREVVATGLTKGLDNPEHDINSPTIGLDNWVHFANWDRRVRRVFDEEGEPVWEVERTRGGGQWGLGVDELGRIHRNTNPNPLFVDLVPSRYGVRNRHQRRFDGIVKGVDASKVVYPSRINPGVNRGYQERTLRDDFTLHYFTAACAPTPLNGDGLGEGARGDVFVAEPSGNLVKRYSLEGGAALRPKANSEHGPFDFWTSTDERFRPVAMTTGPDGALYVADFYRGIIQHRVFMTTFLRKQVDARGLAQPLGQGRIWRVVKSGTRPAAPVRGGALLDAPLAELVAHVGSDNAWLRAQAQRLLVEFFDGEASVVEKLRAGVGARHNPMRAVHSLHTLEGIGFIDPETIARGLASPDARVRAAACEVSEGLLDLEGSEETAALLGRVAATDEDARVRTHALLALGDCPADLALDAFLDRMAVDASSGFERSAVVSGLEFREARFLGMLAGDERWSQNASGRPQLLKDLASCIGREGLAEHLAMVVDLALEPPAGWWSRPLLDGLFETRRKGPRGERLPIALRAMPASFSPDGLEPATAAAAVDEGCTWPGKPGAVEIELPRELTAEEQLRYARGAEVFAAACATCHQSHGGGDAGKAPTLRGTQYAVGDERRLVSILMHGLEGPLKIDGETWNLAMPRFEGTDEQLSDVLTFVRRSWGNGADPVTLETVRDVRMKSGGRTRPLQSSEL